MPCTANRCLSQVRVGSNAAAMRPAAVVSQDGECSQAPGCCKCSKPSTLFYGGCVFVSFLLSLPFLLLLLGADNSIYSVPLDRQPSSQPCLT